MENAGLEYNCDRITKKRLLHNAHSSFFFAVPHAICRAATWRPKEAMGRLTSGLVSCPIVFYPPLSVLFFGSLLSRREQGIVALCAARPSMVPGLLGKELLFSFCFSGGNPRAFLGPENLAPIAVESRPRVEGP